MAPTDTGLQQERTTAEATAWHALPSDEVLTRLEVSKEGLDEAEAARRLERYGPNELPRQKGASVLTLLMRQINNPIIYLLLGAGALAFVLGKVTDAFVVIGAIVVNVVIGFIQEFRAGKAIESLAQMVPQQAHVLRDGEVASLSAAKLVPGDVVQLASGDRVPADLRLFASRNLKVEEAALTGESVASDKRTEPVEVKADLGDRHGMVYGGTMVTAGTGSAVVVATGHETELGRISRMLSEATDLQTPLTRAIGGVGKWLTLVVIGISLALFAISMFRGYSLVDALLVGITLAVATIPEGLPAIITIALAIGVQRMARQRAVVRKLPSVETLGSTTVICTDKTGTLTRNEMTVQALWTPREGLYSLTGIGYAPHGELKRQEQPVGKLPEPISALLHAGVLCNDAALHEEDGRWTVAGDPTEAALLVSAKKVGLEPDALVEAHPRLDAIPFESENQFMATLHRVPEGQRIYVKGAPEVVLARCRLPEGIDAETVSGVVNELASRGMRILALAHKNVAGSDESLRDEQVAGDLEFLGLQGMIDPPRSEAIDAVRECHAAGITVKMITGDHLATAEAIGRELGLLDANSSGVTGAKLATLDDAALQKVARETNVFARVAPEHKLALVRALQREGHIAAMTGDGVNDAPALKQANIGVAMGITGTAVSKEAADVVLADDNFATISAAVLEGRRIYDNLVKSLAFILPANLGLGFILMAAVFFFPIQEVAGELVPLMPALPTQILWINLVSSVALSLPLAFEVSEPNVMTRPPRKPNAPILGGFVLGRTLLTALLMAAGSIGVFWWAYFRELSLVGHTVAIREAQTMAVTTVIFFQVFYLLNCRSLKDSVFHIGFFSNKTIFVGIAALLGLQAAFIYLPMLQNVFQTAALTPRELVIAAAVGALILPVISVEKFVRTRFMRDKSFVRGGGVRRQRPIEQG